MGKHAGSGVAVDGEGIAHDGYLKIGGYRKIYFCKRLYSIYKSKFL